MDRTIVVVVFMAVLFITCLIPVWDYLYQVLIKKRTPMSDRMLIELFLRKK